MIERNESKPQEAGRYKELKPGRKGLKVRVLFKVCKMIHRGLLKKEPEPSADNRHWLDNGWL